jgi:hypothetical protein
VYKSSGRLLIRSKEATVITLLDNLPANVLGVEVSGDITRDDYAQILLPAIDRHREAHGKVRLLYILDDEHDFTAGALWEDEKLFDRHPFSFAKIAIATNAKGIRGVVKAFGWMIPGDVKLFSRDDIDQARSWISS